MAEQETRIQPFVQADSVKIYVASTATDGAVVSSKKVKEDNQN